MAGWSYNSTMAGTYTGAVVRFTDPNDEEEYSVMIIILILQTDYVIF